MISRYMKNNVTVKKTYSFIYVTDKFKTEIKQQLFRYAEKPLNSESINT